MVLLKEGFVKVFILGSGGREHALADALSKSALVDRVFWTPGNAGTDEIADNPHINIDDFDSLLQFAKNEKIDITVVGPELTLVNGIVDLFTDSGLSVFGPTAEGAKIEGSKLFAKALMKKRGIPTASYAEFFEKKSAMNYIKTAVPPYVIKADGLAAGKGVAIVQSEREAEEVLYNFFERKIFGKSGLKVVIEDFLEGEEATVLALCDGKYIVPLISSQDHKPAYDGDKGPNTGGMGAIAPAPVVSALVMGRVVDRVLLPLVDEFISRGIDYRGVIYAGLMIQEGNPFIVEFNCRFGDPELEAVVPLIDSDFFESLFRAVNGELDKYTIKWKKSYACDVVMVSGGYPGKYEKGKEIEGLERLKSRGNLSVFHAGTKRDGDRVVTNGGRVLNIVGTGKSLRDAVDASYGYVKEVQFENAFYRRDIGFSGLKYFK